MLYRSPHAPFCLLRGVSLSFRFSSRRAGRAIVSLCCVFLFDRIFDRALAACLPSPGMMVMSSHLVISSCGDVLRFLLASRFACVPSAYRPASSTRAAGRGTGVGVACFFLISTVCRSRHPVAGCAGLLACSDVRRSVPSCCMLCADFVDRVRCGCRGCFAMIYCHCVVGGG